MKHPKKRPWFQYHLSTAIVLMLVASGIMGANFAREGQSAILDYDKTGAVLDPIVRKAPTYGWPLRFTALVVRDYSVVDFEPNVGSGPWPPLPIQVNQISYFWLGVDIAFGLAILLIVAVLLERPIPRRERERKERTTL